MAPEGASFPGPLFHARFGVFPRTLRKGKSMKQNLVFALATTLICLALLGPAGPAFSFSRGPEPMTATEAAQSGNAFAWDLYGQLATRPGNLFFSPASIDLALVMTWTGAREETARDMGRVLHLDSRQAGRPEAVSAAFGQLQRSLVPVEGRYTLRVANRLWGLQGYPFRPSFLTTLENDFGAGLQELDFQGDPDGARQTINTWVEEQTEDKIRDLLPPGSIGPNHRLVLTNAVYFLGDWQRKFQGSDTRESPFFTAAGQEVPWPAMHQTNLFDYTADDLAQVVILPYQGGEVEMVVVLPRSRDGLAELEQNLDGALLDSWLAGAAQTRVRLQLPKFSLTGEFSLTRELGSLGMASAFSRSADFSGMAPGEGLYISDVIHKSFIDVFEKGTEAAAATAVNIRVTSMPMPQEAVDFIADHPFVFLIRHVASGQILFLGRLADPRG